MNQKEQRKNKFINWIDLKFSNDFMFGHVLKNEELLKEFASVLLGFDINDVDNIEFEKTMKQYYFTRGVRLDVYFKSSNKVINIEMQVVDRSNIKKRGRYYQSSLDSLLLETAREYTDLNDTLVVFICCYDPFDKNQMKYVFKNYCKATNTNLDDGRTIIIFNTKGKEEKENKELSNLLKYIDGNESNINDLTRKIESEVDKIKTNEILRCDFMKQKADEMDQYTDGKKEGIIEGIIEGKIEGKKEGKIEIAKKLKDTMTDEEISKVTELDIETIKEL
ncbi:MAG: Rpn family recombination-promoting nuclease/putative transposase [bacterium]